MKYSLLVLALSALSPATYANCVGPTVNGECLGTEVPSYGSSDGYQGSSGSNYQYDLNNGSDRNSYSIDLDAQRRDQQNTGVGRSQDRSRGQYGGGVYDD
ncbi:MAG TPA: hypothetical protein EYQ26_13280 [Rhodospirillales bacterium]|nr:hypothetical protein [Rhodospirillales bacterium]